MPSETVAMTGDQNIDGLLAGVRWSDTVITYGMPTNASEYGSYEWLLDHDGNPSTPAITVDETDGFVALAADQQQAVNDAFGQIGGYVVRSILRTEPGGNADIRVAMSTTREPGNTTAYGAYPSNTAHGGDSWFNTTSYNDPFIGTYDYQTFFHEIGHNLGLKHGHEGANGNNTVLASNRDSQEFSVMTYRSFEGSGTSGYSVTDGHYPQTFMMLDIAALQHMYGADYTTNADNTTYRFDPNTAEMFIGSFGQGVPRNSAGTAVNILFRTIWDGGGNDTYDFSAYGTNRQLLIDLAPGGWTDVDADSNFQAADLNRNSPGTNMARGQVFNALLFGGDTRSLIENAIGGAGDDQIRGNQASNRLEGRGGRDLLYGLDGNDTLDPGNDNSGSESYGGSGGDYIYATGGADYIDGGTGFDIADYSRSNAAVIIDTTIGKALGGWANNDTIVNVEDFVGSNFDDSFRAGDGSNILRGGGGDDSLEGGGGNDSLHGGDGNDFLRGGDGADYIDGGTGFDAAVFDGPVSINLATGNHGGAAAGDTFVSIEEFRGSTGSDTFTAGSAGARFVGGDDVDYFYGGSGGDWFQGGRGADYINGGGGFDMVSYADATSGIQVDMTFTDGTTDGKIIAGEWGTDILVSIEDVQGTSYADRMYGDERSNKFEGLGGDDLLQGDPDGGPVSGDILLGGDGNDTIVGGASDFIDGGNGIDTARFQGGAVVLDFFNSIFTVGGSGFNIQNVEVYEGSSGNDSVRGGGWAETIILGAGNDTLIGGGGNDFLYTGDGADYMDGGDGFDTVVFDRATIADWQAGVLDAVIGTDSWLNWEAIQGSSGNDRIRTNSWGFAVELRGGAGNDTLAAGVAGVVGDRLLGEDGNDALDAGAGNDTLDGGTGQDTLVGGAGVDLLTGGADADVFEFNSAAEIGMALGARDVVTDFQKGIDRLDLDDVDANASLAGVQHFTWVGSAAHTGSAASLRYVQSGGNTIVYGDINGDGNSDFGIQLNGLHALTADDFTDITIAAIRGTSSGELIPGTTGAELILGLGGNDTLRGGLGADTLTGGDGEDVFAFNSAAEIGSTVNQRDVITDFLRSIDRLDFSSLDANINLAGRQAFTWMGTAGHTGAGATLRYQHVNGNTLVYGDINGDGAGDFTLEITGIRNLTPTDFSLGSIGTVQGTAAADVLTSAPGGMVVMGLGGDDTITGNTGNDTIWGGAGADRMTGREGSDLFRWASQADLGNGSGGRDVITDFVRTVDLLDFSQIDANTTVAGNQSFTWVGTAGHTGAGATLRYQHLNGNTLIYGDTNADGAGDFTLELTGIRNLTASDFTVASIGTIQGTNGNDTLVGAPGGRVMLALNGDDTITGGAGADTIWGGAGADRMTGGAGADQFKWAWHTHMGNTTGGRDVVMDFQQGLDKLDLAGVDANLNVAGDQAFAFLGTAGHTGASATLRYQQSGGNTFIYGDVNGDKAADFTIVLTGLYNLTAADFVL